MKTVKILSLTLFMSIFCVGTSLAQQPQGQKVKSTPEERAAKRIEMMKESLDLTPEQVTKIQDVQAQFAKEQQQVRDEARKKHEEMKTRMEAYDVQMKSILTPEQYQKYKEGRQNMKQLNHGKGNNINKEGSQGKGNKGGKQQTKKNSKN